MEHIRIYIGGTFDLLHPGHIKLFKWAKRFPQSKVIVSLNTDEFAARYKRPPVLTLEQRIELISAIKYVDLVVVNEGCEDSKPTILEAHATHILHGDDWPIESLMVQMGITQEWLDQQGITMMYAPYTKGVSTTQLIAAM